MTNDNKETRHTAQTNVPNESVLPRRKYTHTAPLEREKTDIQYIQEQLKIVRACVSELEDKITEKDMYIEEMKKHRKSQSKQISRLSSKLCNLEEERKSNDIYKALEHAVNSVLDGNFSRYGQRRICDVVAKVCWNLHSGVARTAMMTIACTHLRKHFFTPQSILKAMD